jgi:hypothetical protein
MSADDERMQWSPRSYRKKPFRDSKPEPKEKPRKRPRPLGFSFFWTEELLREHFEYEIEQEGRQELLKNPKKADAEYAEWRRKLIAGKEVPNLRSNRKISTRK